MIVRRKSEEGFAGCHKREYTYNTVIGCQPTMSRTITVLTRHNGTEPLKVQNTCYTPNNRDSIENYKHITIQL